MKPFAELQSIDFQLVTRSQWIRVCRLLESVPGEQREAAILYVGQASSHWPKSICRPLYSWWGSQKDADLLSICKDTRFWALEAGCCPGEKREIPFLPDAYVVWCPAGSFTMGMSKESDVHHCDKQTKVVLSRGFWMWETPLTEEQFEFLFGWIPTSHRKLLEQNGQKIPRGSSGKRYPVGELNWFHALSVCNELSSYFGLEQNFQVPCISKEILEQWAICQSYPRAIEEENKVRSKFSENEGKSYYQTVGFRLPTEAEWEYACVAGLECMPCDDVEQQVWCWNNTQGQQQTVKQKEANGWGLYDMVGSCLEWCWDKHMLYPGGTVYDYIGATQDEELILKHLEEKEDFIFYYPSFHGILRGSGLAGAEFMTHTFRSILVNTVSGTGIGMRPVLSIDV